MYRHTPDFMKILQLKGSWMEHIGKTTALRSPDRPKNRYIEYPAGPPPPMPKIEKPKPKIRGLEGRSLDEVVLPFIDDSDTEEEEDEP